MVITVDCWHFDVKEGSAKGEVWNLNGDCKIVLLAKGHEHEVGLLCDNPAHKYHHLATVIHETRPERSDRGAYYVSPLPCPHCVREKVTCRKA